MIASGKIEEALKDSEVEKKSSYPVTEATP
jgi:hypothetical protein